MRVGDFGGMEGLKRRLVNANKSLVYVAHVMYFVKKNNIQPSTFWALLDSGMEMETAKKVVSLNKILREILRYSRKRLGITTYPRWISLYEHVNDEVVFNGLLDLLKITFDEGHDMDLSTGMIDAIKYRYGRVATPIELATYYYEYLNERYDPQALIDLFNDSTDLNGVVRVILDNLASLTTSPPPNHFSVV